MAPTQPGAVVDLILRDSFGLLLMVYGCLWANLVKSAAVSLTTPHTHTKTSAPKLEIPCKTRRHDSMDSRVRPSVTFYGPGRVYTEAELAEIQRQKEEIAQ